MKMSHFDEKSGIVDCKTPWGSWWQTIEEVYVEVSVPEGTAAKSVRCGIGTTNLNLSVSGKLFFEVCNQ